VVLLVQVGKVMLAVVQRLVSVVVAVVVQPVRVQTLVLVALAARAVLVYLVQLLAVL
jgi:hypothetical protein